MKAVAVFSWSLFAAALLTAAALVFGAFATAGVEKYALIHEGFVQTMKLAIGALVAMFGAAGAIAAVKLWKSIP